MTALLAVWSAASPAVRHAIVTGAALLVAALVFWGWLTARENAAYKQGTADMKAAVEKQDAKAVDAARKAATSVDACFDAGGEWDQTKGVCRE